MESLELFPRRGSINTELGSCATLAPDITAGVERAWVEQRHVSASGRHGRAGYLWATDSVSHRGRHRRGSSAKADVVTDVEKATAIPGPCLGINTFEGSHSNRVGGGEISAVVVSHDSI